MNTRAEPMDILQRNRQSLAPIWLLGGLLGVAVLAALDSGIGDALSLAPLYTILIVFVTWRAGGFTGVILALACAIAWLLVDLYVHNTQPASALVYGPNVVIRAATYLGIALVIGLLRAAILSQWHDAHVDALTGTGNVRAFYDAASTELRRAHRHRYPLTVACLDVDDLKRINARFGHRTGDLVLRAFASVMIADMRSSDVLARLGGDEFAVLLPHGGREGARAFLARLRSSVAEHLQLDDLRVTFSAGVMTFEEPPASVDEMLGMASRLLNSAKEGGGNQIVTRRGGPEDDVVWQESSQSIGSH